MIKSIEWCGDHLKILDQTQLPLQEVYQDLWTAEDAFHAIQRLQVRGAPLIGIVAAYGLALEALSFQGAEGRNLVNRLREKAAFLKSARPTAVNLPWALERVISEIEGVADVSPDALKNAALSAATKIHSDDRERCERIALAGQEILPSRASILTICNTGALATGGIGTALGVVYRAHEQGKQLQVYASETRPLLQGARLTVWELSQAHIPVTLITDNMAGWLFKKKKIDRVVVGADRIASNGATANKIGTYSLAVLAKAHGVPFYVAAPLSTFDLSLASGDSIPIEERDCDEVRKIMKQLPITLPEAECWNPAFDVTPPELITGIITDAGIVYSPFEKNIYKFFKSFQFHN